MKKLLLRADDLGYSEGVNYGILKSVQDGLIGSVGLMVNMQATEHGLNLFKDIEVCLGQHTNISVGRPVSNPEKIPSLVDENGFFKSSKMYRSAREDFVVLEEVVLEIEAQYHKFIALTGKKPDYFDMHAVASAHFFKGLEIVAEKYNLKYSGFPEKGNVIQVGDKQVYANAMVLENGVYDPIKQIKEQMTESSEDRLNMFVCHPGYLDQAILQNSSLTVPRTIDVEMACSEELRMWLIENQVERITYNDL